MSNPSQADEPHVVIVGGGFGGLQAAKELRKAKVRVSLVDKHNYHLFQPLLYQVATGGLSPANIAAPLRSLLRRQANCEVLLAEATGIDLADKRLLLADGELHYDFLVLAAGATHSYFGRDDWQSRAPGLKTLTDATNIRRRIFIAFEAAERQSDPEIRKALMTFVVVGGGPTGVELAGALSEIAKHTLRHDFRHINPKDARILLVEAGERVLSHYPVELCEHAAEEIRSLGIEVHTHTKVTEILEDHVLLRTADQEVVVPTHTVLWAAGVQANPLGKLVAEECAVTPDRAGRIPVSPTLNIAGHDDIYVIGDLALCLDEQGKPLPGMAPVAMQEGAYVAARIKKQISGQAFENKPFHYRNRGSMATIGRAAAVAQIGKRQFYGFFAWIMWLTIHLMQIVQFQNRLMVFLQWGWNYLTFGRSARLITGQERTTIVRRTDHDNPMNDLVAASKESDLQDEVSNK